MNPLAEFPGFPLGPGTPTQRRFRIGGLSVLIDSDLPLAPGTFIEKLERFAADEVGPDVVRAWHHFGYPEFDQWELGDRVTSLAPWLVYRRDDAWTYVETPATGEPGERVLVFSPDYREVHIFNGGRLKERFLRGSSASLTMMPTDQVWLVQLMPLFGACFLHAGAAVLDGRGILFVGGARAGKSSLVEMLNPLSTVLSDDRIIARHFPQGGRIYGTWSHGDYPAASPQDAQLSAVVLLSRAERDLLEPVHDPTIVSRALLGAIVRPLVTRDWMERTLIIIEGLVRDAAAYKLEWSGSPQIVSEVVRIAGDANARDRTRRGHTEGRLPSEGP